MSGPGDIDGEVSGDEAAWRDLIARFDTPADRITTGVPWPAREDLSEQASLAEPAGTLTDPTESSDEPATRPGEPAANPGTPPGATAHPSGRTTDPSGRTADASGRNTDPSSMTSDPSGRTADPSGSSDHPARPTTSFAIPMDRMRVIRPAGDPRSYTPPEEADEPFVPVPLPPPAKLDTASKAALAGVIGGPGYLLIASVFLHWTISAEAALIAVAAFVAGFVTLVMKLGDRSGRDDDDDGAVV
jgi:hypothetical protein